MRTALKSFVAAALAVASAAASAADAPIAIGYVTKSATNEGWVLINKGAEDAAREDRLRERRPETPPRRAMSPQHADQDDLDGPRRHDGPRVPRETR